MMFVLDLKSQMNVEEKQCNGWLTVVEVGLDREKFPGFTTDLQPNKLSLFILSESKYHWDSVRLPSNICAFVPFTFFSVCLRLQSKFCELWSKSSIFHLPASVQRRQLSLKSVSLTASWPVMRAAAKSHHSARRWFWQRVASVHRAATLSPRQSVSPFYLQVTLWPSQKVQTRLECRRGRSIEGAACSAETFKALWEKKPVKLEGRVGSHFSFSPLWDTHTLTTTKIHTYRARTSCCDTLLPFFRGCVCLSLVLFIYLFFTLCKVKHFDRCWFFQR